MALTAVEAGDTCARRRLQSDAALPNCGAATGRSTLDGRHTETGWTCTEGGAAHFLQAKASRIRAWPKTKNRWLFPPVVSRNGSNASPATVSTR